MSLTQEDCFSFLLKKAPILSGNVLINLFGKATLKNTGTQITCIKTQMDTVSETARKRIKEQHKWGTPGEEEWGAELCHPGLFLSINSKGAFWFLGFLEQMQG